MYILAIIVILVLVLIIYDMYKTTIKALVKGSIFFIKSPAKAIKAHRAKKATAMDKKELRLRKKARDSYFNGEYLFSQKFTEDQEVKSYIEIKNAKENLKRHKKSIKKTK